MSMMICALCKVQQVAYTKLAAAFDNEATASSSLRRIQRLIAECVIDTGIIAKLILKLILVAGPYDLAMGRLSGSKVKDKDGKPELQILILYCNAEEALEMYRKRWQIATMFKGLKSSGFNIEDSHVRNRERMSNLFSIIMIAYVWCYLVGYYEDFGGI